MSGISRDEWLQALGDSVKPLHPDALTVADVSEQFGIGRQAAYYRIKKLMREKKAVRVFKLVLDDAGRLRPQPAYLLKKAK